MIVDYPITDEERGLYRQYRVYLRDYTLSENWWEHSPKDFSTWKEMLTEEEHDLARRARNCPIPVARRNNQAEYRHATAFEALIGFWYLEDKPRLDYVLEKIKKQFFNE